VHGNGCGANSTNHSAATCSNAERREHTKRSQTSPRSKVVRVARLQTMRMREESNLSERSRHDSAADCSLCVIRRFVTPFFVTRAKTSRTMVMRSLAEARKGRCNDLPGGGEWGRIAAISCNVGTRSIDGDSRRAARDVVYTKRAVVARSCSGSARGGRSRIAWLVVDVGTAPALCVGVHAQLALAVGAVVRTWVHWCGVGGTRYQRARSVSRRAGSNRCRLDCVPTRVGGGGSDQPASLSAPLTAARAFGAE
jgi:hypothetical protein